MGLKKKKLSLIIPTLGREEVLIDTLKQFLKQEPVPSEIFIIDQTLEHTVETEQQLRDWNEAGVICWIRKKEASQPFALNDGLRLATQEVVLFVDDDIRIEAGFVKAHLDAYSEDSVWAVAGQVLQPNQNPIDAENYVYPKRGMLKDVGFPFHSKKACFVENGMSGNLSVRRELAIQIGGFDENFIPPVSYRFDNEFCKRLIRAGGKIYFEPKARIYHLAAPRGGTRSKGSHLTSASPIHGQGDYYFALKQPFSCEVLGYLLKRPFREVRTRFHLKHPWYIPFKLVGELRAFLLALRLWLGYSRKEREV